LINSLFGNFLFAGTSITHFPLVIDNIVFNETIDTLVKKSSFKKCKIITGFNKNEMGSFIIGYGLLGSDSQKWEYMAQTMNYSTFFQNVNNFFHFYPTYPNVSSQNVTKAIVDAYLPTNQTSITTYYPYLDRIGTDFVFACQSFQLSEIYSKLKNDVYFYEFDYRISSTIYPEIVGTVHTDELTIVFDELSANKVKKRFYWLF